MARPAGQACAIALFPLDDIPDGGARGVELDEGPDCAGVILLRSGNRVRGFINRCPHQGTPLDTFPDRFLDETGSLIICSTHGARFRADDGTCVEGPCKGAALTGVDVGLENGCVILQRRPG